MANIVQELVGKSADVVTHGLKEFGSGDMVQGIARAVRSATNTGRAQGGVIGLIAGVGLGVAGVIGVTKYRENQKAQADLARAVGHAEAREKLSENKTNETIDDEQEEES